MLTNYLYCIICLFRKQSPYKNLQTYTDFVHRIGLMMFKYSKDVVPLPIIELFTRNYEFHNHYILDKVNHFILQLAEMKRSKKHLHFMALEFGTTYQQKFQ